MGYRDRVAAQLERDRQHRQDEREDKLCYAEPHLRDYEAAMLDAHGKNIQATYVRGWVEVREGKELTDRFRLQEVQGRVTMLHATSQQRVITGENG